MRMLLRLLLLLRRRMRLCASRGCLMGGRRRTRCRRGPRRRRRPPFLRCRVLRNLTLWWSRHVRRGALRGCLPFRPSMAFRSGRMLSRRLRSRRSLALHRRRARGSRRPLNPQRRRSAWLRPVLRLSVIRLVSVTGLGWIHVLSGLPCLPAGSGPVRHRRWRHRSHIMFGRHRMALRRSSRTPMINRRKLGPVRPGRLRNLLLGRHRPGMRLTPCLDFSRLRPLLDAAPSAIEAIPVVTIFNVVIVVVVHPRVVDIVDGAVVIEVIVVPVPALVAISGVAKSIVDTAIEPDMRTPIAGEELVAPAAIAPVARCPQGSIIRRFHPHARHPVIALRRIEGPIAGRPEVVITRCGWLIVFGQRRWRLLGRVLRLLAICGLVVVLVTLRIGTAFVLRPPALRRVGFRRRAGRGNACRLRHRRSFRSRRLRSGRQIGCSGVLILCACNRSGGCLVAMAASTEERQTYGQNRQSAKSCKRGHLESPNAWMPRTDVSSISTGHPPLNFNGLCGFPEEPTGRGCWLEASLPACERRADSNTADKAAHPDHAPARQPRPAHGRSAASSPRPACR